MATTRNCWMPVLAALLAAVLVGAVGLGGSAAAGTGPRATIRTVTIPAVAFTPLTDDVDYSKGPAELQLSSGTGVFFAPVYFEAPEVTIRKVVFYVVDGGSGNLILGLYRVRLAEDQTLHMGEVHSVGAGSWEMQTVTLSDLAYRRITGGYGAVLHVYLPGTYVQGYRFMGAKVIYSY